MGEVARIPRAPLAASSGFEIAPQTFQEAMQVCEFMSQSALVPDQYRGKPADIYIAINMGRDLGLTPTQALQGIAVIGKRPTVWGDTAMAVVQQHPDFVSHEEWIESEGDAAIAWCKIQRKNRPELIRKFSMRDAAQAGLKGKDGPWKLYPQRMLQMRARSWALRDSFPDALKGISIAEEMMDVREPAIDSAPAASRGEQIARAIDAQLEHAASVSDATPAAAAEVEEARVVDVVPSLDDALDLVKAQFGEGSFQVGAAPAASPEEPAPSDPDAVPPPSFFDAAAPITSDTTKQIQGTADTISAQMITDLALSRGLSRDGLATLIVNVTGRSKLTKSNVTAVHHALRAMPPIEKGGAAR